MAALGLKRKYTWWIWGAATLVAAAYLGLALRGDARSLYLIGETTHGHYQIEMACDACHTSAFGGGEALQQACVDCHGEELKRADDSHPKSKFTDPRNAARVAQLDARECVTCHREHRPDITRAMGVTLANDFCVRCHADIADDRPSHKGAAFASCASGGCHNYHDNRALYEDFLIKHLDQPALMPHPRVPQRNLTLFFKSYPPKAQRNLTAADQNAPAYLAEARLVDAWARSGHAAAGVNCADCHVEQGNDRAERHWLRRPGAAGCTACHGAEVEGFFGGKHGMRLARGLSPMQPALARSTMQDDAAGLRLGCGSCHDVHAPDTHRAAVDACLGCHADDHSLAYRSSAHYRRWQAEINGAAPEGSGVSCATCHLPRTAHVEKGRQRILVQHNQNDNLRPNEKMIRGVCLQCHGLGFSIDALADPELVRANFNGRPSRSVPSLQWAAARHSRGEKGPEQLSFNMQQRSE